jgi:uncharacterized repeat protein (TIGR03803 family)
MRSVYIMAPVLAVLFVVLTQSSARAASQEQVVLSFDGTDGSAPNAGLVSDAAGNLYGTTLGGGANHSGTVFELLRGDNGEWTEQLLYSFNGGTDGWQPLAGLVFDAAGDLYGTTSLGGSAGDGTVFELTPGPNGEWTETVLHSFSGPDGNYPMAGVIFDAAGNLYGTTQTGGTAACECGVVFELSPEANGQWTETVLYNFDGKDGWSPLAGLTLDNAGNLYGTTAGTVLKDRKGTLFELTPSGHGEWFHTVLHNFGEGADGAEPHAGLVFDTAGNLYTTTYYGGIYGYGAVVEVTPGAVADRVLYSFNGNGEDGRYPEAALIFDGKGNLYGTTAYGGTGLGCSNEFALCGIVFELTPGTNRQWTEQVLHNFLPNNFDGVGPLDSLTLDAAGNLYGTTLAGGAHQPDGTVFEVTP